jgi:4-hydroxy-2-oxoheptanedioate aldolase
MRYRALAVAALVAAPALAARGQATDRLNPMVVLHEKALPLFGIAHPALTQGRGGQSAPLSLSDVAKETFGYKLADYHNTTGAPDVFLQYMVAMREAGASVRTNPFIAKIPIWRRNPDAARQALIRQLNAGHVGVSMQQVETAEEIREVASAMRFASAGGTRPDSGYEAAAAYWGLTPAQYRQRADLYPLNKAGGELVISAIIESRAGLENIRAIAAEPAVATIMVGYGTLGQVFSGDAAGREAAVQQVLAACKEFRKRCGFPTNTAAEVEQRMKEGFAVFIMQSRNAAAFAAVEAGRKLAGR